MFNHTFLKLSLLLGLALSATFGLTACKREASKSKQPVIAVIPKGVSHSFWLTIKAGADAAGQELGATIDWKGAASETDIAGQINIVEDAINRRVDGIVIAPSHGDSLVPIVLRAQREGIPVTIFDSGISTESYLSYVATDNRAGGMLAGQRMGERLNGKGKVAILGVKKGSVSTDEREEGFAQKLKEQYPGIQLVQWLYGDASASKSLSTAEDILTSHPDLNGLFASNESSTVGAVRAIRQRNLGAQVVLVGFDATPDLVNNVRDSSIDSLVIQNPYKMGFEGVRTILDKLAGRESARRIDTGVTLLTRENVDTAEIQQLIRTP
ncbi:MAG: sugar ABC transporter substrate-binding protein [Acidobacteria bacterium]|nr:sugar ABC transporter substrate-binding protein [Acidobacteriota bacterium]